MKKKEKIIAGVAGAVGIILAVIGVLLKIKKSMAVSVIGGADGPTSIFLAGKVGGDMSAGLFVAAIICLIVAVVLVFRKKK